MNTLPDTKKSLGQHWLTNPAVLQSIVEAGEVTEGDTVLEIGPGPGTLTRQLLNTGAQVTAVEFDHSLAQALPSVFTDFTNQLTVVEQDILRFDFSTLSAGYKVIANIPYYLTSNLIRVMSETSNRAAIVVILIQKEVAERVAAQPGDMSLLSVNAQFYWQVSLGLEVPAQMFTPPPKVDSQVLVLRARTQPLFAAVDESVFFRIVKAGFSARRKTLENSLAGGLRLAKTEARELLERALIQPSQRAQALSLDDWYRLYQTYLNT